MSSSVNGVVAPGTSASRLSDVQLGIDATQPTILRRLSAEIRLVIFKEAMSGWDSAENKSPPILTALIGQPDLYAEALEVFYQTCYFTVDSGTRPMIKDSKEEKFSRIKKLRLTERGFYDGMNRDWDGTLVWYNPTTDVQSPIGKIVTRAQTASPIGKVFAYATNVTELYLGHGTGIFHLNDDRAVNTVIKFCLERFPKVHRLVMGVSKEPCFDGCGPIVDDHCSCYYRVDNHLAVVGRFLRSVDIEGGRNYDEYVWEAEQEGEKKALKWLEESEEGFGSQRVVKQ